MFVRRFYDEHLAQASYLIGCQKTGQAIAIDPARDVSEIVEGARKEGFKITMVTETHIHADFLSGARELAAATGARPMLSAEGGNDWQYAWPANEVIELLHHGDVLLLGGIRINVRHTPGHTPEHLSFVITDTARSEIPVAMVSGDFLFVGDVGRPDLLERAAGVAGSMEDGARQLFRSIKALADLPDHLQIWPGHGAGSACGKALGAVPSSTLGYERLTNWAFAIDDEDVFVKAVLEGQPSPPTYFATMKRMNREGPPVLGKREPIVAKNPGWIADAFAQGIVVDVRTKAEYAKQHLRGTYSLPLIKAFPTWAGWLLPYDRILFLIAALPERAEEARRLLSSIGLDNVAGAFGPEVITADATRHLVATSPKGDILDAEAMEKSGRMVVDVRNDMEWSEGHIPGAVHHQLGMIEQSMADVDRNTPVAVHCQGGTRSHIAAAALERMGFKDVIDLTGGYGAWRNHQ